MSVGAFRTRALDHAAFAYIYLEATYLHVRNQPGKCGQVVSMAVVVATGVTASGDREILGLDASDSEDEVFRRAFLLSLKQRGLTGVQLVINDQHTGLVSMKSSSADSTSFFCTRSASMRRRQCEPPTARAFRTATRGAWPTAPPPLCTR